MKLTFKDLKHSTKTVEDLELTDTVESLMEKAKEMYGYADGVKLIYCGRILEKEKVLSDYFKDDNTNSFVVCMPERPKPQVTPTVVPAPVPAPTPDPTPTPAPVQPTNTTYSEEQIRAFLIVFTQFMRMSPDVFHIYCTNPRNFQEFLLSDTFVSTVMRPMLQTSSQVMTAIQTGQNINVPIPVVANIGNTHNTTLNTQNEEEIEPENLFTPVASSNSGQNVMNAQDQANIQELTMLGFPVDVVTQAYIMSGKNKEIAASLLFEL